MEACGDDVLNSSDLRILANSHFEKKEYGKAAECYNKAISLDPSAILYANRSFANLKLENYGSALSDASKAIELDSDYNKGYYRRASANMALGKFKDALKDLESLCKKCPGNQDIKEKYDQCKSMVNKIGFEKAISVEKESSIFDVIDIENMEVENDYQGPHLDGEMTLDFIESLTEMYQNSAGNLHKKYAYMILRDIREFFMKQPTLVDIEIKENEKFTVCGDIHGQFFDLMNIFDLNGIPSERNPYLFNGDFVDRGSFSVECIFTLFSYKLLFPDKMFMARGNHESKNMNQMYGFEGEVKAKYSEQMVEAFTEVYNWLPLAHCLNKRVLVMHGGLFAQNNVKLDDIRAIKRNRQPPEEGLMCDILWSDPMTAPGRVPSKRGVGIQFGPDVTEEFVTENGLDYIIRSHEVKKDGYEMAHNNKCVTVFSAPNYCDTMGNLGAFLTLKGNDLKPKPHVFQEVPHPDVRPMFYASSLLHLFM